MENTVTATVCVHRLCLSSIYMEYYEGPRLEVVSVSEKKRKKNVTTL
jgi:hypothetical protein